MSGSSIVLVVAGGLNTDIVALGVDRLLSAGELTRSGRLLIGPGGKSCNLARMAAALMGPGRVAMMGKTSRDPYGLWRVPVRALEDDGVDTRFRQYRGLEVATGNSGHRSHPRETATAKTRSIPCRAINDAFSPGRRRRVDVVRRRTAARAARPDLRMPLRTAVHAVRKAASAGMSRPGPGNVNERDDYGELLGLGISVPGPRRARSPRADRCRDKGHESAREAARVLRARGIENTVLTHGAKGAYVFAGSEEIHVKTPAVARNGIRDATGCGDQVTAVAVRGAAAGQGPVAGQRGGGSRRRHAVSPPRYPAGQREELEEYTEAGGAMKPGEPAAEFTRSPPSRRPAPACARA